MGLDHFINGATLKKVHLASDARNRCWQGYPILPCVNTDVLLIDISQTYIVEKATAAPPKRYHVIFVWRLHILQVKIFQVSGFTFSTIMCEVLVRTYLIGTYIIQRMKVTPINITEGGRQRSPSIKIQIQFSLYLTVINKSLTIYS